MTAILGACGTCQGEGRIARADGGVTTTCTGCNGFGKSKRGYGTYKTQALADRHGVRCWMCHGVKTYTPPLTNPCYSCNYNPGQDVAEIHPGDTLPDVIGRCASVPREVAVSLASEWEFVPMRFDRGQTWGEAYLGLGSIWSCTDYGAAWEQSDAEVIARVRESFDSGSLQWLTIMDSERTITPRIVVKITRGGYSVIGSMDNPRPSLPPTYTDAVLNSPV